MNYEAIITCLKMFIEQEEEFIKNWYDKGLNEEFGPPAASYFIGLAETAIVEVRRAKTDAAKN